LGQLQRRIFGGNGRLYLFDTLFQIRDFLKTKVEEPL
jgi:hypothetical protein